MTTINDTIQQALNTAGLGQYERQARPVVDALVAREQQITASLLDAAAEAGVDREQATRTFEGLGLALPTGGVNVAGLPADVAQRIQALEDFARRNGFRG